jgi:hypothetical protein
LLKRFLNRQIIDDILRIISRQQPKESIIRWKGRFNGRDWWVKILIYYNKYCYGTGCANSWDGSQIKDKGK